MNSITVTQYDSLTRVSNIYRTIAQLNVGRVYIVPRSAEPPITFVTYCCILRSYFEAPCLKVLQLWAKFVKNFPRCLCNDTWSQYNQEICYFCYNMLTTRRVRFAIWSAHWRSLYFWELSGRTLDRSEFSTRARFPYYISLFAPSGNILNIIKVSLHFCTLEVAQRSKLRRRF